MLIKLKIERLKRNIKSKDIARKAEIDPSYLTLIEKGRMPSHNVRCRLAKAVNLPMKDIWD